MKFDRRIDELQLRRFPHYAAALDRHLLWAMDYAAVGEQEAAEAALLDACALAAEIAEQDAGWHSEVYA
jgi:hypothetical protein